MKLVKLNDITEKLFNLRKYGNYPGVGVGYSQLDPLYTVRLGNTTYVTGWPTSGKTTVYMQILCNLTSIHGWSHALYSPETGTAEEIYAEIIHCLTGKSFNSQYANYITEKELFDALPYVTNYFKVIEPTDSGMTLDHWFDCVRSIQSEFSIKTAGIDNWNDLEHDMQKQGNKISEYLKYQLPRFNRFAKTEGLHGFLLVHPRNPDFKGKDANSTPPAPRPDEIEGGSLWYAKAQSILIVHRDWSLENNYTTNITVAKAKPKIVGKKGMMDLEYNVVENCFYENAHGFNRYIETNFKPGGRPKEETYDQKRYNGNGVSDSSVPF